jgi:hypothetical protein
LWGDNRHDGVLVAFDRQVATLSPQGTLTWRAAFQLPPGESTDGVAANSGGAVYLLTPTSILRLARRAPARF